MPIYEYLCECGAKQEMVYRKPLKHLQCNVCIKGKAYHVPSIPSIPKDGTYSFNDK